VNPGGREIYCLKLILHQESVATFVHNNNPISIATNSRRIREESFIVLKLHYVIFDITNFLVPFSSSLSTPKDLPAFSGLPTAMKNFSTYIGV
jgi:hypothetical protein